MGGTLPGPPPRLDELEVLGELGRGAQSEVLLVRGRRDGHLHALKVFSGSGRGSQRARSRFRREARVLSDLDHPNLVGVHAILEHGDGVALLLEYVPGPSLASVLRHGRLRPAEALMILGHVGAALDAAHARGVVHRDVKPSNVLLSAGAAKLSDFGLATLAPGTDRPFTVLTHQGVPLGTAPYMSPEAVEGRSALDGRADVYSFGAVAYELLTGTPPFPGASGMLAVLSAHLHEDPPLPSARDTGLPKGVDAVLLGALAKVPDHRPSSAGSVVVGLRDAFDGAGHLLDDPDLAMLVARVPPRRTPPSSVTGSSSRTSAAPPDVALPRVHPTLPRLGHRHPVGATVWWMLGGLLGGAALVAVVLAALH